MRFFARISILGFVLTIITVFSPQTGSTDESTAKPPHVKVSLAVTEGYKTAQSPLRVVIENISDKAQDHFEEWNSWGYSNITIEWADASGKTGTVKKLVKGWDKNFPSTIVLDPGDTLVREVTFDPNLWEGWPEISDGTKLTLKACYQSSAEPRTRAWTGKVISKERKVLFR